MMAPVNVPKMNESPMDTIPSCSSFLMSLSSSVISWSFCNADSPVERVGIRSARQDCVVDECEI